MGQWLLLTPRELCSSLGQPVSQDRIDHDLCCSGSCTDCLNKCSSFGKERWLRLASPSKWGLQQTVAAPPPPPRQMGQQSAQAGHPLPAPPTAFFFRGPLSIPGC